MEDLFNVTVPLGENAENNSANANEFRPKTTKAPNGVYEALIRFIPWAQNPSESLVSKNTAYLTNLKTGQKREVDTYPNSYQCPVANTFFALRDNANPVLKERADMFSRRQRYAALVQIIQNNIEPALVGKVLVYRFGVKIHRKLMEIQEQSSLLSGVGGGSTSPFSLLGAPTFYLKQIKEGGFENVDQSRWIQSTEATAVKCPIKGPDGQIQRWVPITEQTLADANFKQIVTQWLTSDEIPSLEPYKFHEWSDETRNFVSECIKVAMDPTSPTQSQNTTPTAGGIFNNAAPMAPVAAAQATPVTPVAPAAPVAPTVPPVNVAAPAGGLDFSTQAPAPQTAPGGFGASNITGLDDILGNTTPQAAPAPAAAPAADPAGEPGGLQLGDILGDIMQ